MNLKTLTTVSAFALSVGYGASAMAAPIVNTSFESGLDGWTSFGTTGTEGDIGVAPTDGAAQGALSADDGGDIGDLESALGLGSGSLENGFPVGGEGGEGGEGLTDGSAIWQTFDSWAGDELWFDWDFFNDEDVPQLDFADTSFAILITELSTQILLLGNSLETDFALIDIGTSFTILGEETAGGHTGSQTSSFLIDANGPVTLVFGVFNAGDTSVDPTFLVDNIRFAPKEIPEPASLAILGAGLAGLGLARRRRRK